MSSSRSCSKPSTPTNSIGKQPRSSAFKDSRGKPIPHSFDYHAVPQLRHEAKEKLHTIRPASLGQASRVSGIHPADLAVLLLYLHEPLRHPTSSTDQE
jgi:tRNA uridine 5-carboxymethylaminomethyl modification enzyme